MRFFFFPLPFSLSLSSFVSFCLSVSLFGEERKMDGVEETGGRMYVCVICRRGR